MNVLLGASIAISNALCDLAGIRLRSCFDKWSCRLLLGHPRIVFGSMRDICLDCLTVVDEHPNGRGR